MPVQFRNGLTSPLIAAFLPFAAAGLQWIVWSFIHPYVWFLFYPAVFFSAWIDGMRGGIIASLISSVLVVYIFMEPQLSFTLNAPLGLLSVAMFVVMGTLFGATQTLLKKANARTEEALRAARTSNDELEKHVTERTAELTHTMALIRASEDRFRSTLDNMMEGCQIIGGDWRYTYLNDAAERHNRRPNAELLGQRYADMWPGIETTEVYHLIKHCLEERVPHHFENDFVFPDGTDGWFDLSIQPVPEGVFILSIDITERKTAEATLRRLNEDLEERVNSRTMQLRNANMELESFSYSVSHDLRAPLRHISGYVDLLKTRFPDALPEKGRHYLETIGGAVHQMGALIDDLLEFSRTGRIELHAARVDMNTAVADVIHLVTSVHPGRVPEWIVMPLPSVYCDEAMMKLVWTNLLSNAVKFSRTREHARIEIGVSRGKGEYIFSVRDNGVGFDMRYAKKLFGVFQRLHPSDVFEGTGIGLATVSRIVSRHMGRTWAEAELDKGAAFFFTLPEQPAPAL